MDITITGITDTWTESLTSLFYKWNKLLDQEFERRNYGHAVQRITVVCSATYYKNIVELPKITNRFYKKDHLFVISLDVPPADVENKSLIDIEHQVYDALLKGLENLRKRKIEAFDIQTLVADIKDLFEKKMFATR